MNGAERALSWQRLREAGIAVGELPGPGGDAPWYVRAMLGIAGWMAAAFGLALIGLLLGALIDRTGAALLIGVLLCAGAGALYRLASTNDFLAQLAFVTSLGGQALIGYGLFRLVGTLSSVVPWVSAVAAVELMLLLLLADSLHRLWCTLAATACAVLALGASGLGALVVPLVAFGFATLCLGETRRTRHHGPLGAVGSALALALALAALARHVPLELLGRHSPFIPAPWSAALESVLIGLVLGGIAWRIASGLGARTTTRCALVAAALALAVATHGAPGIPAALIIVVVGFASGRRALVGLGLFALLGYLSRFYYVLDQTLLAKSATLIASGVALLALGTAIDRLWREPGDAPDA